MGTSTYILLDTMKYIAAYINGAGATDPSFFTDYVSPHWLHVTNSLIALHRIRADENGRAGVPSISDSLSHLERRLGTWREFGKSIRIDEAQLREAEVEKRTEKMGGLLGCGWFKCPSFRTPYNVPGRELLACSGCRKVRRVCLVRASLPVSSTPYRHSIAHSSVNESWCLPYYMRSLQLIHSPGTGRTAGTGQPAVSNDLGHQEASSIPNTYEFDAIYYAKYYAVCPAAHE